MKKRLTGILAVLCFVFLVIAATPATAAKASGPSPITTQHAFVRLLTAYDNGGFQAIACRQDRPTDAGSLYFDATGTLRNTLQGPSTSDGATCADDSSYAAQDGTLYGARSSSNGTTSTLVAWKNNRQLWEASTTSSANCVYGNSWTSKAMQVSSISQGPDGNIYLVLSPSVSPQACDDQLMGVNAETGAVLFEKSLGSGPAPGSGMAYNSSPTAWTYNDAIVVVDRSGMVREFGYDGVENVSAAYQLPAPSGHTFNLVAANDAGTVFAFTYPTWTASTPVLLYHQRNGGTSGSITDGYAWPSVSQLQPTSDGNVIAVGYNGGPRLDHFDVTNKTVTATYPTPQTSGYAHAGLSAFVEDENGNQLTAWTQWDSSGNQATSIDLYDKSSAATSTIFLKEEKPSDPTNYPDFSDFTSSSLPEAIGGGNLYLGLCEHDSSTCSNTPTPDLSIYKVSTGSFDRALGKGFKRNSYVSQKLNYVAMGDSFSSGEGNPDFNPWTDRSGVNECHRSQDYAYPELLVSDYSLNLSLTDFVACSGAATDNVLYGGSGAGGWSEPAQIDALSANTNVVTISIGGNDVGFRAFATQCVTSTCGPSSPVYQLVDGIATSNDYLVKLEYVYNTILHRAPNAKVYAVGYPYVTPSDPSDISCLPFQDRTNLADVTDSVAARQIVDALNAASTNAVTAIADSRLIFVDPTKSPSLFEGHDVCSNAILRVPNFKHPLVR